MGVKIKTGQKETTIVVAKKPVLFLPGIMGSVLCNPLILVDGEPQETNLGHHIWSKASLKVLKELELIYTIGSNKNLFSSQIENLFIARLCLDKRVAAINLMESYYEPFRNALHEQMNYVVTTMWSDEAGILKPIQKKKLGEGSPDAFFIPYDWRRCNWETAQLLAREIKKLRKQVQQPFTIVAHSMGGIVARLTLEHCLKSETNLVDTLVTVGTPHHGSLDAIGCLLQRKDIVHKHIIGPLSVDIFAIEQEAMMGRSWNSLYQLLPTEEVIAPSYLPHTRSFNVPIPDGRLDIEVNVPIPDGRLDIEEMEKISPQRLWNSGEPLVAFEQYINSLIQELQNKPDKKFQDEANIATLVKIRRRLSDQVQVTGSGHISIKEVINRRNTIEPRERRYFFLGSQQHQTAEIFAPLLSNQSCFIQATSGDGTVHIESSTPILPNHRIQCERNFSFEHSQAFCDSKVHTFIFDLLRQQLLFRTSQNSAPSHSPTQTSPQPNNNKKMLQLKYTDANGKGIPGAKYQIFCRSSKKEVACGTLNHQGKALHLLPEDIGEVSVQFSQDPELIQYIRKPMEHPEKSQVAIQWPDLICDEIIAQGRFGQTTVFSRYGTQKPELGQVLANIVLQYIPTFDEPRDVLVLVSHLSYLINAEQGILKEKAVVQQDDEVWLGLVPTLLGSHPSDGSLLKSIGLSLADSIARSQTAPIDTLLCVFNYNAKGHAVKWLRKLQSDHLDTCFAFVVDTLSRLFLNLETRLNYFRNAVSCEELRIQIQACLQSTCSLKVHAGAKVKNVVERIKQKLTTTLQTASFQPSPNTTYMQKKQAPPFPPICPDMRPYFQSIISNHVNGPYYFLSGARAAGIRGAHNVYQFIEALNKGECSVVNLVPCRRIPGVLEVIYLLHKKDKQGRLLAPDENDDKTKHKTKTVYHPDIWTEAKLLDAALEAYSYAWLNHLWPLHTNRIDWVGYTKENYKIKGIKRKDSGTFYFDNQEEIP